MFKIRKLVALAAGKLLIAGSRALGQQGTNMPGRVASLIYPPLLAELSRNITRDCFIVTGTNGKTTTSNLAAAIIREQGCNVVHNQAGANMLAGITSAFIQKSDLSGQRTHEYALLETDEANVAPLLQILKPRYLLITNFFRDQLDRYGELDTTVKLITSAVQGTDIELILNADDPLQSHWPAITSLKCVYYGFDRTDYDSLESADSREGRYCMLCGHEMEYSYYHYAQLGKFQCPHCGHHNQPPEYLGSELSLETGIDFKIGDLRLESRFKGFYNAYNILAAATLALEAGFSKDNIRRAIASHQPAAGRMETFMVGGKEVFLILVKNPTGFDQSLAMLTGDSHPKNVFVALNDNAADGRDISWIWDTQAELLARSEDKITGLICSGQRSGDMALRFKYAGLDTGKIAIEPDLRRAIEQTLNLGGQVTYVLCTYTALFACRKILLKLRD